MAQPTVNASERNEHGKGAARRTRSTGKVPGVIYGHGKKPLGVAVEPKEIVAALSGPHKRNTVISLKMDGGTRSVMVKELQIHPVRRTPTHVDFYEVQADKPVRVRVPLEITGKSKAAADGGKVNLVVRGVNIEALPANIPPTIAFDVTDQGFGVVRVKQLTVPQGVKVVDTPDTPVISVRVPRGEKEEEVAATPAEGAAAPAAGAAPAAAAAAAAPAAGAKAAEKKK